MPDKVLKWLNFSCAPVLADGISLAAHMTIKVGHDPRFFPTVGLLLLAGGFIFVVYDGARWVADQTLRFTRFGQFWNDIHQSSQQAFRTWVESNVPWLWNSVVKVVLDQPVFAVMGILGIVLMILFRPRKPLIGYSRD